MQLKLGNLKSKLFIICILTKYCSISVSENGWTDGKIAEDWVTKVFDLCTRAKANGAGRVLLLDGHSSHFTEKVLRFCLDNNICILGYPAHCTHRLQGLDVVYFARMKELWMEEIWIFQEDKGRNMKKENVVLVFGNALMRAFTVETILAAFSVTGINPFNPKVITDEEMMPSEVSSSKASFPLPLASPVRAIMASYRYNPPTAFDLAAATEPVPENSSFVDANIDPSLYTPSKRQYTAIDVDPNLYTPSKRQHIANSALARTSGSYLLSSSKMTSAQKLPIPVFEHTPKITLSNCPTALDNTNSLTSSMSKEKLLEAYITLKEESALIKQKNMIMEQENYIQKSIIEGTQAQLVIGSMHLSKLHSALYEKENKPEDSRLRLFANGNARVWTDEEIINVKAQDRIDKELKEKQKEDRKAATEA